MCGSNLLERRNTADMWALQDDATRVVVSDREPGSLVSQGSVHSPKRKQHKRWPGSPNHYVQQKGG